MFPRTKASQAQHSEESAEEEHSEEKMGQPLLMTFCDDGKDTFENSALRFNLGNKPLGAAACMFAQISLGIQKTEADCLMSGRGLQ